MMKKTELRCTLVSVEAQALKILDHTFHFDEGETIHTENSYKYVVDESQNLARKTGWKTEKVWLDSNRYFSVYF